MSIQQFLTDPKAIVASAGSAVSSPIWVEWLDAISPVAAKAAPVLGIILILVQLYAVVRKIFSRK